MGEKKTQKEKEVFVIKEKVDINGGTKELTCKTDISHKNKGQFSITLKITTDLVDPNDPHLIIPRAMLVLKEALTTANDKRLDILRGYENPNQTKLFNDDEED